MVSRRYVYRLGLLAGVISIILCAVSWSDESVRNVIMSRYPTTQITDVRESELPGIYEVVMGQTVGYTDKNARYMIMGHLYDLQSQKDITMERLRSVRRVDVSSLPLQDAITYTEGTGKTTFYVFTDPECPFCRKLEAEIFLMKDIKVYYYLIPTHQSSPDIIQSIYCASDAHQALADYMISGKAPVRSESCRSDKPQKALKLASSLGIHSTPTIVSADGRIMNGYARNEEVSAWLAGK